MDNTCQSIKELYRDLINIHADLSDFIEKNITTLPDTYNKYEKIFKKLIKDYDLLKM